MNEPWKIYLLGGLRAEQGQRRVTRFRTQQTALLLAYLSYFRGAQSRDVLIEALWPESHPAAGRHALSNALSSLRHQLEPPGVPAGAVIQADRHAVELSPAAHVTDVSGFKQALQSATRAGNFSERIECLTRAVDHFAGPLLPGYYADWIYVEQAHLSECHAGAIRQLVRLLEQSGDLRRAIEFGRRGVAADPLMEEAHQELIRLLVAAGQPTAALRQYAELERLLRDELGAAPSAATRSLIEQIERMHPSSGLDRAPCEPRVLRRAPVRTDPPDPVTATFLVADVPGGGGSAGDPPATVAALRGLFGRLSQENGGAVVTEETGGILRAAFRSAVEALACALAVRQGRSAELPDDPAGSAVRMALYTGDVHLEDGAYRGAALSRSACLHAAGHGHQILCSEATAALLSGELANGVRLRELGFFRLRDQDAPERVFQIDYLENQGSGFPPLNASAAHISSLPIQFTRFFGREEERAHLHGLLAPTSATPPRSRLITLTGPGGTGKTRLAVEAAGELVEAYRGAVWLAPLHDLSDPSLLPHRLAETLRLSCSPGERPLDKVVEFVARQPSLLVLDTLEHLFEGGTECVCELLQRAPELRVLVTSQRLLGVSGERAFPVAPLPLPDGPGTPEQLLKCESVQLFVDRAQAVKPDFQLTPANAGAVAQVCRRLEGIPLAIELAAARAQVLPPAQMLTQLERRFDFLVSRGKGVPERQRTLRAAIEWSYRLLSPELQRFFTRLAVFRGGWSLEAAESVCEEPLALDYLAQLAECSLIASVDSQGSARFRMLDTLREYAAGAGEAPERAQLRRRHAEYHLGLAEQARSAQLGPEEESWLDLLAAEHDNMRAALTWSGEAPEGGEVGLRLCAALYRFWSVRGYLRDGRECCMKALAHPAAQTSSLLRAAVLRAAALLNCSLGEYGAAQTLHERALALNRELGDQAGEALGWNGLGNVALGRSDYVGAFEAYERSLALHRSLGNREVEAMNLGNMALIANILARYDQARDLVEQALAINRELGDRVGEAANLDNLANALYGLGETGAARELYRQALTINRLLGHREWAAANVSHLGILALGEQDFGAARRSFQEALTIAREVGHRRGEAASLNGLGRVATGEGEPRAAAAFFQQALRIAGELGDRALLAEGLAGVASLMASEDPNRAARLWGVASQLRDDANAPLPSHQKAQEEREQLPCESALGAAAFAAALAEGRRLSFEQALTLALQP